MDPHNAIEFCDRKASDYWGQVDIYIGGTEHAVGHLLYSRMWTKILFDLGYIGHEEPFKKLVNQGMIQGSSRFVLRIVLTGIKNESTDSKISLEEITSALFISHSYISIYEKLKDNKEKLNFYKKYAPNWDGIQVLESNQFMIPAKNLIHVDVNIVDGIELDLKEFKKWKNGEFAYSEFLLENDGKYICEVEIEKMSKSKYNTVNPDVLVNKFGADTFRMYEMFLGPVEQSKPWDTKGIEGVHRFLRKLWRLFFDDIKGKVWDEEKATNAELKILHRTIKKIEEDTERFSFNTAVSTFMICVNELADVKCHKKEVLENVLILLTPYAPHIAEELWDALGNDGSVLDAVYPKFDGKYLVELSKEYPISINGKVRANINMALDLQQADVEKLILQNEIVQKWLEGKDPKKIIYVKNKMVNVVV